MADSNKRLSLSFSHLASVPKRDSGGFLQEYLKEQRLLLSYYASQGPLACVGPAFEDGTRPERPLDGFGTPVLKARAALGSNRHAGTDYESDRCGSPGVDLIPAPSKSTEPQKPRAMESKKARERPEKTKQPDDSTAKKKNEVIRIDSDEESTTKRLKERRERRREKREIVKKPVKATAANSDSDKENGNEDTANGRNGTKHQYKKKGAKAPPGLALMHGFSSKAVGKNRLTMDVYSRSTGVFSRGKASERTKVNNNGPGFLESAFLDRRMKRRSRSKESKVSVDSLPKKRKGQKLKKIGTLPQETEKEPSCVDQDMTSDAAPSEKRYDPADSVVWEIEKESEVPDKVTIGANGGWESVVLPVPCSWAKSPPTYHHADKPHRSSPSIGPSQSASQINADQASPKLPAAQFASKYFPPSPARPEYPQPSSADLLPVDQASCSDVQQHKRLENPRQLAGGGAEKASPEDGLGPAVAEPPIDHAVHAETEAIRIDMSDEGESLLYDRDLAYSTYPADIFPASEVSLLDLHDHADHGTIGMGWDVDAVVPHYCAYSEPEGVSDWEQTYAGPLPDVQMDDVAYSRWREDWDFDGEDERFGPSYGDEDFEPCHADTPMAEDAPAHGDYGFDLDAFDDADEDALGHLEVFRQGRALLYGLSQDTVLTTPVAPRLSGAEADVVRSLGGSHWAPYRLD